MTPDISPGIVLQDSRRWRFARDVRTSMRRTVGTPVVLFGGLLHAGMWAFVWIAGEIWAVLHLFFGIPLILACFAALLGLWCVYVAIQAAAGFVRGLYLRLLLRSAERL